MSQQNNTSQQGNILDFTISNKDTGKSADFSPAIVEYRYYESVLANSITAMAVVVETGNGPDNKSQLDSLPIRGGEEAKIKIEDNQGGSLDVPLFVDSVRGAQPGTQKDVYFIDFCSQENLNNDANRVVKRYEGKISEHVNSIMSDVLQTQSEVDVDETSLEYNFNGNKRKPFYVCTWLASKAVPKKGIGGAGGFLFFQTREGFKFKSIDSLFGEGSAEKKFLFNNTGNKVEGKDANVLNYAINTDTELAQNLTLGTYNNRSIFFDLLAMNYKVVDFSIDDQEGKVDTAGKKGKNYNFCSKEFVKKEKPTRYFTHILDIGVNPKGSGEQQISGWEDEVNEGNFKAEKTTVQTVMRYNQLFSVQINIIIPGDFSIKAGDLVECDFPELSKGNSDQVNKETGGIYMVAHVCHRMTPDSCFTSLGLVRDSYGKKGGF